MTADDIIWRPRPEVAARSRIGTFLRTESIATLSELQRRSVADPEWYWTKVVEGLGIRGLRAPRCVLDDARGPAWPVWFPGGLMNLADSCVDRHVESGRAAHPALIWEGDDGSTRQVTYGELLGEVSRLANALRALGFGEGDRVGIFLPMSLEAAIATLAVVRIGAIYTPCFSGFGAQAVASRLQDSEAKVLITADGFHRRGQVVRMKETADEALALSPTVKAGLVHGATGVVFEGVPDCPKPDRWWGLVERHRITVMGLSPTAVRALMPHGADHPRGHDLSSLRILGSTGEPWNPEPYRWLFEQVGGSRLPIINYTGGTEISGGILGCFPIAPLKPCSFTGPIPGIAADGVGDDGRPVRGQG